MLKRWVLILMLMLSAMPLAGQGVPRAADFGEVCDTLTARCNRHFGVVSEVALDRVMLVDGKLDCIFSRTLADYPWHKDDVTWFAGEFSKEAQTALRGNTPGRFFNIGGRLEDLVTPVLTRNG